MLFSVFSLTVQAPPRRGAGIVAPPEPSPLPAGEGIMGRGKGREKRKNDFHASWCPEGHGGLTCNKSPARIKVSPV